MMKSVSVTSLATLTLLLCSPDLRAEPDPSPEPVSLSAERTLPVPGSQWAYTSDNTHTTVMRLGAVDGDIATYAVGRHGGELAGSMSEHIGTYTASTAFDGQRMLFFPLSQGKQWEDQYEGQVKVRNGAWRYQYKAEARSKVVGAERITVGAGTFDTWVVERVTHWTSSNPEALDEASALYTCTTPSCSVSGISKQFLWYAPEIGRAVLKAVTISGSGGAIHYKPDFMQKNYNALRVELVAFSDVPDETLQIGSAQYASLSGPFIVDFPIRMNNTWEFQLVRNTPIE